MTVETVLSCVYFGTGHTYHMEVCMTIQLTS